MTIKQILATGVITASLSILTADAERPLPPREALLEFGVPKAKAPPVIDGRINDSEWDAALLLNGIAGSAGAGDLFPREVIWQVMWDEQALYLACRSHLREGERLVRGVRGKVGDTVYDDSVEFYIDPQGRNQSPTDFPMFYQLIINSMGAGWYGIHKPQMGVIDRGWMPDIEIANGLSEDGKWWDIEIAIPNAAINLQRPTRSGDMWGLILARNFKGPWVQTALPVKKPHWTAPAYYGAYRAEDGSPYMRMLSIAGLQQLRAHTDLELVNPGKSESALTVDVIITGADKEIFSRKESLKLSAGERRQWKIDEALPAGTPETGLTYNLRVTAEGQPHPVGVYSCKFHKLTSRDKSVYLNSFKDSVFQPVMKAAFNPVRSNIELAMDLLDVPESEREGAQGEWKVRKSGDDAPIAGGKLLREHESWLRDLVELPKLAPGNYEIDLSLLDKNGKVLYSRTSKIEKLDETKEFPWWRTKAGNPDQLLPPFTPLSVKAGVAGCWGREYHLDGMAFPSRIVSQAGDVLAGPITPLLVVDGKPIAPAIKGPVVVKDAKEWALEFTGSGTAGPVSFTTCSRLEQDGAYFITFTYEPTGDPVTIDSLTLEIPVRPTAESLAALAAGGDYSALLDSKSGTLWNSTMGIARNMTIGSFVPTIWIGDERNGLFWFAENDRGWVPRDDVPASELVRTRDALVLRHNLIMTGADGVPFKLDAPRTVVFALLATPAAPQRPDWRKGSDPGGGQSGAFSIEGKTFERSHRYDPETKVNAWTWYHPESRDPSEWDKYFKKMHDSTHWEYRKLSLPSTGYGLNTGLSREKEYFAAEWGANDYTPTLIDHYVWCFDQYVRKGNLAYIYLDVSNAALSSNLSNDRGYLLADGRVQPGYHHFGRRELHKRLNAVFVDAGKRAWIAGNNIGMLATTAFMTSYMTGDDNITVGGDMDFADVRAGSFLRALAMPMIMGGVKRPFYERNRDPIVEGHLYLHNIFSHQGNMLSPVLAKWDFFEQGDKQVFFPFWRNADLVTVKANRDVKCSLLRQGEKLLVVAANYDKEREAACEFLLQLDKLGLAETGAVYRAIPLRPAGGTVTVARRGARLSVEGVTIPPRDYVMISIEQVK